MTEIIDPKEPNMVNINGQDIDAGYGLVTPQGKPLSSKKGQKLARNLQNRQQQIEAEKNHQVSIFIENTLKEHLPEKKVKGVKTEKDAQKLLDKLKVRVIRQDYDKFTHVLVVQSLFRKPPAVLGSQRWKWK